jgi:hypothetical protein
MGYDNEQGNRLHRQAQKPVWSSALTGMILAMAALGGCDERADALAEGAASACLDSGLLRGRIYGAVEGHVDWRAPGLSCEGMRRPDDAGVRLRFAGPHPAADDDAMLAFIIALPEIGRGDLARETPSRVTLIEENSGRFFSTGELDACWSDVTRQAPVGDNVYDIRGIVYCVSPLAELNGSGSVRFTELEYAGRVDWSAP